MTNGRNVERDAGPERLAASRRPVTGANRVRGDRGWFNRAGRRLAVRSEEGRGDVGEGKAGSDFSAGQSAMGVA